MRSSAIAYRLTVYDVSARYGESSIGHTLFHGLQHAICKSCRTITTRIPERLSWLSDITWFFFRFKISAANIFRTICFRSDLVRWNVSCRLPSSMGKRQLYNPGLCAHRSGAQLGRSIDPAIIVWVSDFRRPQMAETWYCKVRWARCRTFRTACCKEVGLCAHSWICCGESARWSVPVPQYLLRTHLDRRAEWERFNWYQSDESHSGDSPSGTCKFWPLQKRSSHRRA